MNEALEERVLLAAPTLVKIASTNTGRLISTDPLAPETLAVAPEQFTLTFNPGQVIDVTSAQNAITVTDVNGDPVNIGFIGGGANPEDVVVRFAETLTDGSYDINISGSLQNAGGEAFTARSVPFNLDLGAQIVAVVPQPVDTSGAALSQSRDTVVVYFNDDPLDAALAEDPSFYQLINESPNPANPNDLVRFPTSVVYDSNAGTATLTFSGPIEDLFAPGETVFRLRIGTNEGLPTSASPISYSATATTDFGYSTDVDSDGVLEFAEVTFHLADPDPGTSEEGKAVQIRFTVDAGATTSTPVITTDRSDAATNVVNIQVSSAAGFVTSLQEVLAGLAGHTDAMKLIRMEITPNSNLAAAIGASLPAGGETLTLFDAGSSFRSSGSQANVGTLGSGSVRISGAIDPQKNPLDFPGGIDEPGQREIEIFRFVPSFDTRYHPSFIDEPTLIEDSFDRFPFAFVDPGIVNHDGVETLFYNFQTFVGFDPEGTERTNVITENQKQRVREVFQFYGNYLGVQFVETANRGFTIARSDLRVIEPEYFNGAGDNIVGVADPARQLAILDAAENWNDTFADYSTTNGSVNFFEEAMEVVGLLLGLGNTDHQPPGTVQGSTSDLIFATTSDSNTVEVDYPGDIDIVAGQHVHPPESKDIDLYQFTLDQEGLFSAEVFAERLTGADTSLLDSGLKLYRQDRDSLGGIAGYTLIASNDDYFSEDAFIELNLQPGTYFIGVSASGNMDYDPTIADSGLNGRSEGKYELNLNFRPNVNLTTQTIDFDAVPSGGTFRVTFDGNTSGPIAAGATAAAVQAALEPLTGVGNVAVSQVGEDYVISLLNGVEQGKSPISVDDSALVGATAVGRTNVLADATGTLFDGDHDGVAGGVFNFWFRAASPAQTIFVNRTETLATGVFFNTLPAGERVYAEIDRALAAAASGTIVRVVGNSAGLGYEIGRNGSITLRDGNTLEIPKDVAVMIDAGAILKLQGARIGVGSFDQVTDRSGGSLQVLGTPDQRVVFTSWRNEAIGGDTTPTPTIPGAGDWGGIVFQENIDSSIAGRTVWSDQGVFLNYVAYGEFTYGGGRINVGSVTQTINPIHTVSARPTVLHNTIVLSSDSAMSADPDSFEETKFSDFSRIGPEIFGNILSERTDNLDAVNTTDALGNPITVQNATNGLSVRILTPSGSSQNKLTVSARFDDRDITHVITANLEIQGTPGGHLETVIPPELDRGTPNQTRLTSTGVGDLPYGTYSYRMTWVTRDGGGNVTYESPASDPSESVFITGDPTTGSAIRLTNLPAATGQFNGRRLYRSHDGIVFTLVAELNASTTTFVDNQYASGRPIDTRPINQSVARYDARLAIDPGILIKMDNAAIQTGIGAQLIAEGEPGREIIFTSRKDDSYGAGGTFDTNDDGLSAGAAGDWGGIYIGHLSTGSISDSLITFGGGDATVAGGFATFNAVEIHQAQARIVNTILENNADGTGGPSAAHRFGRGSNAPATIFVRGAQPVIADNILRDNSGSAVSINANALNSEYVTDWGRSRGDLLALPGNLGNQGPLIVGNLFGRNGLNGMIVRGEILTTESVWDDTGITHVLDNQEVIIPDVSTFGGLRLASNSVESLVIKMNGPNAGFTAMGRPLDITDRIGGVLHVVGQPGKPVVITSLFDDSVGAGYDLNGLPLNDTNGDGTATTPSAGDWRSVRIDQFAHDRNVGIYIENESDSSAGPGTNAIPDNAEELGSLAPLEDVVNAGDLAPLTGPNNSLRGGGDNQLRLGFQINGTISEANDVDVYSFSGIAGSEVWIDIDRTAIGLDTVVELIDINGGILASSDDTLSEQTGLYNVYQNAGAQAAGLKANSLNKSVFHSDDFFSTNTRDAGMRVVL
ncbi:MAG: copper resistance protein CopC, partial [Planctomycetaceae bacterium]|nr:copper resistance protein CopC [Planctomycetaceae bacterium]